MAPRLTLTPPLLGLCQPAGITTPSHFLSAASTFGWVTIWRKFGLPISSSPSQTSTMLTGDFLPAARIACSAARKVASGPFWFTAPRPTITFPKPGLSMIRASSGGEDHSAGSNCFTSYMK